MEEDAFPTSGEHSHEGYKLDLALTLFFFFLKEKKFSSKAVTFSCSVVRVSFADRHRGD